MRRPSVALYFFVVTAAAILLGGAAVWQVVANSLRAAAVPQDTVDHVMRDLALLLLSLAIGFVGVGLVAGQAMSRVLRTLRELLLARARGSSAELPTFAIGEINDLASAAERLFARAALHERERAREGEDVNVVLAAISDGIVQLDREGRLVRANPAARTMLGIHQQSGLPLNTLVRDARLRALIQRAVSGQPVDGEEVLLGGRTLYVTARPVGGSGNGLHGGATRASQGGTVFAFTDVTELRRLESVRRDFVANVSHELRTPLTSIRGYVETLTGDEQLPPDVQRQFLSVVQKNADRLHRIVEDLLDLSRLESGGWRPRLETVEAAAIIRDVWSMCGENAARRGIEFTAPPAPVHVHADGDALRQVLSNLFDNAIRHSPDGGQIEVRVTEERGNAIDAAGTHPSAGRVIFEVRDTGSGIPSDALSRVFERFFRVDPARSRSDGGTGLGLSIVKHLVERMGGDVSATSELGTGTVIRFTLPTAE